VKLVSDLDLIYSKGLALDVSTQNFGYCLRDCSILESPKNQILLSGTVTAKSSWSMDTRIEYMRQFLNFLLTDSKFSFLSWVIIERVVFHKNIDTVSKLSEVHGVLRNTIYQRFPDIVFISPPATTWRSIFLGKGNATKEDVTDKLNQLEISHNTEHEAEAIAMAYCFGEELLGVLGFSIK